MEMMESLSVPQPALFQGVSLAIHDDDDDDGDNDFDFVES